MKKMEKRAILCLLLVLAMIAGLGLFIYRLESSGAQWASFYANKHIYKDGELKTGRIFDRSGTLLMENTADGVKYNDDGDLRRACIQLTGDPDGNVSTAANTAFKSRLIGYDRVTGTTGLMKIKDGRVNLTIDGDLQKTAYRAMSGRNGFVSVYNWKTGEIMCMISTPAIDPANEWERANAPEGTYINKPLSAVFTPGSTFKLVTMAAALENIDDLDDWSFECTGSYEIDGEKITCPKHHGKQDIKDALANSCNCAFAKLTVEMGSDVMKKYTEDLGLTESYDIDGIKTASGSFNFDTYNINLGWAGIGQFEDQVNPVSMMVYMGAIAGGGKAAKPVIIKEDGLLAKDGGRLIKNGDREKAKAGTVKLLRSDTAARLQEMTRNNVIKTYKDENFPGLELHAKSGTAETVAGKAPHAWFVGYSGDYAFAVCIENGGYGASVAGPVANRVLQELAKKQ